MCGLKQKLSYLCIAIKKSHPSWVCGLKQVILQPMTSRYLVTPFVGVWIETILSRRCKDTILSHPSWVCGLKPWSAKTGEGCLMSHPSWVCGLKLPRQQRGNIQRMSHPSWVCGLKPLGNAKGTPSVGHTLRGCVD